MAKIRLINSYKKTSVVRDTNGMPILDATGSEMRKPVTMFRYGIVSATPEEMAMYKLSRNQDGENYYREEEGVPLFYSSRFVGKEATINGYKRDDGNVGFSVDQTDLDVLKAIAAEAPEMATAIAGQIVNILNSGERLRITATAQGGEETPGADPGEGTGEPKETPAAHGSDPLED